MHHGRQVPPRADGDYTERAEYERRGGRALTGDAGPRGLGFDNQSTADAVLRIVERAPAQPLKLLKLDTEEVGRDRIDLVATVLALLHTADRTAATNHEDGWDEDELQNKADLAPAARTFDGLRGEFVIEPTHCLTLPRTQRTMEGQA